MELCQGPSQQVQSNDVAVLDFGLLDHLTGDEHSHGFLPFNSALSPVTVVIRVFRAIQPLRCGGRVLGRIREMVEPMLTKAQHGTPSRIQSMSLSMSLSQPPKLQMSRNKGGKDG